jgi:hypothetical protein
MADRGDAGRRDGLVVAVLVGTALATLVCFVYLLVRLLLGSAAGLWLPVALVWLSLSVWLGVAVGSFLRRQADAQSLPDAAAAIDGDEAAANWRHGPSGDLRYPVETLPHARAFGR